jgi:hypothetical protein
MEKDQWQSVMLSSGPALNLNHVVQIPAKLLLSGQSGQSILSPKEGMSSVCVISVYTYRINRYSVASLP